MIDARPLNGVGEELTGHTGVAQSAAQGSPKSKVVGSSPTARAHYLPILPKRVKEMAILGRKEPTRQETRQTQAPAPRKDGRMSVTAASAEKPSRIGKLREHIRNIGAELRKVTWPTRDEVRNLTIVVIGLTAAVGTALFTVDSILGWLYRLAR
jgi:preprotein translocase subunit SecE